MRKQIYALFLMHSIDAFASGLISIFVPIYLLTLGYSLRSVFIFYILTYLGILVFFYFVGLLAGRIGLRKTLLCRFPFLISYLLILYGLNENLTSVYVLALVSALNLAFYWFPLHLLFVKKADNGKMGKEVGKLFAFPKLFAIGSPLLGGAITFYFGFPGLFIIAMIVYAVSAIPLLYMGEFEIKVKLNFEKVKKLFRKYPKFFWMETLRSIFSEAEFVIWPIFVYLIIKNVLSLGAVGTLLGVGGAIFTLFIGQLSKDDNKHKLFRLGAIGLIIVWLLRMSTIDQFNIYLLTILAGFLMVLISIPFSSLVYEIAQKEDSEDFIIFREMPVALGRVILYGFAILLVSNLKLTFVLSIFSLITFLFF